MEKQAIIDLAYILASVLFIFGIKMLGSATTARRGNMVSALGMLVAIIATLCADGMSYKWIIIAALAGGTVGLAAAKLVKMTSMPEMVALFNGFGGTASLLVGWAEYHRSPDLGVGAAIPVFFTVLIGGMTFSGSIIAYGKLAERMTGKPILFGGQQVVNALLLLAVIVAGVIFCANPAAGNTIFIATIILALILGVLSVIPIGGADIRVRVEHSDGPSG